MNGSGRSKLTGKICTALTVIIMTSVLVPVYGCGSAAARTDAGSVQSVSRGDNGGSSVEDVLKQGMEAADAADTTEEADAGKEQQAAPDVSAPTPDPSVPTPIVYADSDMVLSTTEGVDIDLTILSATVVYSEVYNMMYLPEEYIGKTIRMRGMFSSYHDEETDKSYYACIIQDATACCAQGIEFELEGEHSYPEDYPEEGEDVTVEGVFDTYTEGEYTYCTLRNAHYV